MSSRIEEAFREGYARHRGPVIEGNLNLAWHSSQAKASEPQWSSSLPGREGWFWIRSLALWKQPAKIYKDGEEWRISFGDRWRRLSDMDEGDFYCPMEEARDVPQEWLDAIEFRRIQQEILEKVREIVGGPENRPEGVMELLREKGWWGQAESELSSSKT